MLLHRSSYTHWCPQPRSPQVQAGRTWNCVHTIHTNLCTCSWKKQTYSLHTPLIPRCTHPRSPEASTLPGHVCIYTHRGMGKQRPPTHIHEHNGTHILGHTPPGTNRRPGPPTHSHAPWEFLFMLPSHEHTPGISPACENDTEQSNIPI